MTVTTQRFDRRRPAEVAALRAVVHQVWHLWSWGPLPRLLKELGGPVGQVQSELACSTAQEPGEPGARQGRGFPAPAVQAKVSKPEPPSPRQALLELRCQLGYGAVITLCSPWSTLQRR